MSVHEASLPPTAPLPPKPEAKTRPEIPPKPSTQSSSPPLGDENGEESLAAGKVKRIVNKFSKKEVALNEANELPANSSTKFKPSKPFKRAPTIKPKPSRASLPLQLSREQAPPLPAKRSRNPQKKQEGVGGEEGDSISVEGRRSGTAGLRMWVLNFHFHSER